MGIIRKCNAKGAPTLHVYVHYTYIYYAYICIHIYIHMYAMIGLGTLVKPQYSEAIPNLRRPQPQPFPSQTLPRGNAARSVLEALAESREILPGLQLRVDWVCGCIIITTTITTTTTSTIIAYLGFWYLQFYCFVTLGLWEARGVGSLGFHVDLGLLECAASAL